MHMLLDDSYESSISDVIKHLLHFDTHPDEDMALRENDECSDEPPQKKTRRQVAQSHISFAKFRMQGNRCSLQCHIKFSKRRKINVNKVPRRATS